MISRYQAKLSGPLLDRIDMRVLVPSLSTDELLNSSVGEASAIVAQRVVKARERQVQRQKKLNQHLFGIELETVCAISAKSKMLLQEAHTRLHYSSRAVHRVLRLARTIADLAASPDIASAHLVEAIHYQRAGTIALG